ncbi:MAG TPA: glycoside hydrolase family 97 N-terminal domain-containing protein, partial [Cyclobacteriaceae bacterium]|nr:glycoside hydrolase family 97 N-terminal domain-containing protein [Cyclobacteriaceae bacterium]
MKWLSLLIFLFGMTGSSAQHKISSPDGLIAFTFTYLNNRPNYSITFRGKSVVASGDIGLSFNQRDFTLNSVASRPGYRRGIEEYELVVGKVKSVKDAYNEVIIPLRDQLRQARVNMVIRIFNGGLGFRYEFVSDHAK